MKCVSSDDGIHTLEGPNHKNMVVDIVISYFECIAGIAAACIPTGSYGPVVGSCRRVYRPDIGLVASTIGNSGRTKGSAVGKEANRIESVAAISWSKTGEVKRQDDPKNDGCCCCSL